MLKFQLKFWVKKIHSFAQWAAFYVSLQVFFIFLEPGSTPSRAQFLGDLPSGGEQPAIFFPQSPKLPASELAHFVSRLRVLSANFWEIGGL